MSEEARRARAGMVVVFVFVLALVLSQLAWPPRTLLPPGMATGALLAVSVNGDYKRDPRVSAEHRWTRFDLNTAKLGVGPPIGKVARPDPDIIDKDIVWNSQKIGRGHAPTLSSEGRLAYIMPNRRDIAVVDRDDRKRTYRMPRVRFVSGNLRWSPDGRMILYCYPHSTFLFAFNWRFTNIYGVGVLDLASGRNYRVFPRTIESGDIWGVRDAREILWVPTLTETH